MREKPDPNRAPTLFEAMSNSLGPGRSREAKRFNLEVALGLLSFFCCVSLFVTVSNELKGNDALASALISAVMIGLTWTVYRSWRKAGGWETQRRR